MRAFAAVTLVVLAGLALPAAQPAGEKRMEAEPIVVYNLSPTLRLDLKDERARRQAWDTCHLVASLQGIVNRKQARLYLRYLPADDFWWEKLRRPGEWLAGRQVEEIGDLEALLARFRPDYGGVVVYDERVPATSNLASTLAGLENVLCIRYDPAPDSLYARLVEGGPRLPVKHRLLAADGGPLFTGRGTIPDTRVPSTGSAKGDAYAWARMRFLEPGQPSARTRCNPTRMAYYLDAYWLAQPMAAGPDHHTLTNHDFFISRRAFFFDLSPWEYEAPVDDPGQPAGTDSAALKAILAAAHQASGGKMAHVGGFVPWAYKYTNHGVAGGKHDPVPSEWHYAEILSAYNAFMDADAIGLGAMANASFYQHYPLRKHHPQPAPPGADELRARGLIDPQGRVAARHFYAFYVGDYDSAAWLYQQVPRLWEDSARGSIPLSWAFNPNLAERMPPAMAYTRETRTPNDFFVAGDSGAGYLNPSLLEAPRPSGLPSGVAEWERHCRRFYRQWDLSVTGFVIDGFAPAMGKSALDAYARFSPGGIVAQKVPRQGLHGKMPFLRMGSDLGGAPEDAGRVIAGAFRPPHPGFHVFRTILQSPTWHRQAVERVRALQPDAEVVDLGTLLALVRYHEGYRRRHPEQQPFAGAGELQARPNGPDQGLYAVAVGDGPARVEEREGEPAWVFGTAGARYLYFDAADAFLPEPGAVEVVVECLDRSEGSLGLEYDANDRSAPHGGAYKPASPMALGSSGGWRTVRWSLPDARFAGGQNESSDFRLVGPPADVPVRSVVVRRLPPGNP